MSTREHDFHLPYNFVPADTRKTQMEDAAQIQSGTGNHPARHDLWAPQRYSGRIFCRIRTESPLVIGARQTSAGGEPGTVEPYLRDDKPAIPGNSLRGMVGSLVEAISQSALRKLHRPEVSKQKDLSYVVRRRAQVEPNGAMTAVGMLLYTAQGYRLLPLSMPVAVWRNGGGSARFALSAIWRDYLRNAEKQGTPLEYFLPTYVHGYRGTSRTGNGIERSGFLAREKPESYRAANDVRYYMKRYPSRIAELDSTGLVVTTTDELHVSSGQGMTLNVIRRDDRAIGRDRLDGTTEGILKVLGADHQLDEIPSTKHHEMFLPWSEERRRVALPIDLPQSVIQRFLALLGERREYAAAERDRGRPCVLPLLNKGMSFPDFNTHLLDGELVFFEMGQTQDGRLAAQNISFSAVWRRAIAGELFDAFRRQGGNNILPWGTQWTEAGTPKSRQQLTPAELLFGVATDGKPPPGTNQLAALAGRVRFHDATLAADQPATFDPPETLQILSSPKPPSAPFYFAQSGEPAFKETLSLKKHAPNGRKFYLPHREADLKNYPWRHVPGQADEADNQRMRVTPIPVGRVFYCHIDFEHLRANELELLIAALQPGDTQQKHAGFRHRLGLGKPLGLGQIRLEVKAICRLVRQNRYAADALTAPRYEEVFVTADASARDSELDVWLSQPRYRCERQAIFDSAIKVARHSLSADAPMTALRVKDTLINKTAADTAFTLGSRNKVVGPVQYPRCTNQVGDETRLFAWNAENDRSRQPQWLEKVAPGAPLPTLRRLPPGRTP